jgi:hypothetical protein
MTAISGCCPMGCGEGLILGEGGVVWCASLLCPRPAAASEGAGNGVALNIAAAVAHALGLSLDGLVDPCARCGDSPPAGFACTACGAVGKEPAS